MSAEIVKFDGAEADRARLSSWIRKNELMADEAVRIAVFRRRMFLAYVAAGFDEYDARQMSMEPEFHG